MRGRPVKQVARIARAISGGLVQGYVPRLIELGRAWQIKLILQHRNGFDELRAMMVLPFLLFTGAIAAGWRRHAMLSILLWLAGLAAMLAMFRYHVTSSLDLAF